MGIVGRLLGRGGKGDEPTELVANPELENPLGLQVLLANGLPVDYCGFAKYDVEDVEGVWMRTYGAARFGLPDLAVLSGRRNAVQCFPPSRLSRRILDECDQPLGSNEPVAIANKLGHFLPVDLAHVQP